MEYRIRQLPEAEKELERITSYLLDFGEQTASRFADEYENQLHLLQSGVVDYGLAHLPELAYKGYHSCQINNYVMLYYYEDDEVVIAHIFHQSQDYARWI